MPYEHIQLIRESKWLHRTRSTSRIDFLPWRPSVHDTDDGDSEGSIDSHRDGCHVCNLWAAGDAFF